LICCPVSAIDDKLTAQLLELIESPCQLTVTAPPQLSPVVTLLVSGWAPGWRNPAYVPGRLDGRLRQPGAHPDTNS